MPLMIFAQNYTYLIGKYSKETELEAKIVIKIAKDMIPNKKIKLFIPDMKKMDRQIYSKNITVAKTCTKANFIFVKYGKLNQCKNDMQEHYILTNNYRKLIHDPEFIGAFFWSKSRPNIVLVRERLARKNIRLPKEYNQFIEDLQ